MWLNKMYLMLTSEPGLPIPKAGPDIFHFEFFSCGGELVVPLEAPDHKCPLRLCEEGCGVRKVLDNPE
jgi:hypothetical protein